MAKPHENPIDLFWKKVDKSGDCWVWTAGKDKDGYGKFQLTLPRNGLPRGAPSKQRHVRAHVYSWEQHNLAEVPNGLLVMHSCDNPSCVRPEHLSVGTQLENRRDCAARGRTARGERNWNAKLTDGAVLEIRARRVDGATPSALAVRHGVTRGTISAIATGRIWRHLGEA